RFSIKRIKEFRVNMNMQKSILDIGFPAGIEAFVFNIGKFVQQIFIISLGTVSIAANTISWSIFSLLTIPGQALSIVATVMVGRFIGMDNYAEAKNINFYLIKLSTVSMLVLSVLVFPLAYVISSAYSSDFQVLSLTTRIIQICAVMIPILWPMSFIIPAGLRGAGDTKFAMYFSVVSLWVFRVFIGYIIAIVFRVGVLGFWIGMYCDWAARGIVYYLRLNGDRWRRKQLV
ncbi:MAG TPA: MATE family efflux transporter, partial [Clostridia bacterium]|nr:MATE family efflux transporter [Clostridia bacterium]